MKQRLRMGVWLTIGWVPLVIGAAVAARPETWKLRPWQPSLVMAGCTLLATGLLLWPKLKTVVARTGEHTP